MKIGLLVLAAAVVFSIATRSATPAAVAAGALLVAGAFYLVQQRRARR